MPTSADNYSMAASPISGAPSTPAWGPSDPDVPAHSLSARTQKIDRLKAELDRLQKPRISKLAQRFPTAKPDVAGADRDDDDDDSISSISPDDPAIPVEYQFD